MTGSAQAVLLFGASGFVGRNIVERLRGRVARLYGINRGGTAVPGCDRTLAIGDLASLPALPRETVVIHAAAMRYVAPSFKADQPAILSANTALADTVYRFCAERGLSEVRLASSQAVYPASWAILDDRRLLDLDDPPHSGELAYAWSKRWAEVLAGIYRAQAGIHTVGFRLTNPYGPFDSVSEADSHVATAFVIRALGREPTFAVRGNPAAERDFVFAGDVAETFAASLDLREQHGICNLAQGVTTRIDALARAAMQAAGHERPLEIVGDTSGGVAVRRATAEGLRTLLPDLPPFRSLGDGLRLTLAWYREALARG